MYQNGLEVPLAPYEALSYAWGSATKSHPIHIHVAKRSIYKKFKVTESLHSAMIALRDNSQHRSFWIDAVCMDQENKEEPPACIDGKDLQRSFSGTGMAWTRGLRHWFSFWSD
jgi:hypothetical protein